MSGYSNFGTEDMRRIMDPNLTGDFDMEARVEEMANELNERNKRVSDY
jgi:hypothetical protein